MLGNESTIPLSQISPYRGSNTNSKLQFPFIVRTSKSVFRYVEKQIYLGSFRICRRRVSKISFLRMLGYKKAISHWQLCPLTPIKELKFFCEFFVQTVFLSPVYSVEYFSTQENSHQSNTRRFKKETTSGPDVFYKKSKIQNRRNPSYLQNFFSATSSSYKGNHSSSGTLRSQFEKLLKGLGWCPTSFCEISVCQRF